MFYRDGPVQSGRVLLPMLLLLNAGLWAQSSGGHAAAVLIGEGRYAEVVSRIRLEKSAERRSAEWESYAEQCVQRAEEAYDRGEYDRALAVIDSALTALRGTEGAVSKAAAYLWSWKAWAHRQLEQYSEVLEAYEAALGLYERLGEKGPHVAYCYKNAAQVFIRRQDYRAADQYLQAALRSDSAGDYRLSIYAQLVNHAYWQDSLDKALYYASLAMKLSGPAAARASLLSALAQVYRRKGRWTEARNTWVKALAYYRTQPDEAENVIRCLRGLADVAANTSNYKQAEAYFKEAERIGARFFRRGKSRELARLYCEWGDWALQYRSVEAALLLYDKALEQVFPQFSASDEKGPLRFEETPIELWAMNAAARKATALLRQPSIERRRQAARCFDAALAVAERLRHTYGTDEAKLYFTAHNFDLLREAVHNEWALYRQTEKSHHLERLFDLIERGRATALRDALYQQRALALAGVPDSLLRAEEALRRERAATQAAQLQAESRGDTLAARRCQMELFYLERRYAEVLRRLQQYPKFREYLRADRRISLREVRECMADTAALLLFFDAGAYYIGMAITRQHEWAWEVVQDSLFRASLSGLIRVLPQKQMLEGEPERFFSPAFLLRQRLLPDRVLQAARSLVIAPDGVLTYLPFEALLMSEYAGPYARAPYLVRTHALRYTWSAAFLAEECTVQALKRARLLQIAPFAQAGRRGKSTLSYSFSERPPGVSADVLADEEATAAAFLAMDAHYDVLHLSTHAQAGEAESAGIEFYDRMLTLPEIYARRLRASLVVLSACQTNTGSFSQGEGVLSLARAFAYAGAQSLVASFWSVNDHSTARLFMAFYRYLGRGAAKSEALRQAKLDLLSASGPDARKSPYYWAAFTLTGADGTVGLEADVPALPPLVIIGAVAAFVISLMLLLRQGRAKRLWMRGYPK